MRDRNACFSLMVKLCSTIYDCSDCSSLGCELGGAILLERGICTARKNNVIWKSHK